MRVRLLQPWGQASAAVPPGVQQPVAMLQGPQEAAAQSCDGTESAGAFDGSPRAPAESYVWTAVAADTLGDNAMLAAEARALDTPVFDLTGDDLSVVGTYVDVRVDVSNWLGATDTSDWFRIRVTAGLPPSVEIVGGIAQTYRRMDPVSVMAQGIATACDGRGLIKRAVNYTWALTPGGLASTSHDERFYKLPPYSLDVGPYILTVAVTDSFTGDVSTATTALTVEPGEITAEITGGDTQITMGDDHPQPAGEPRPRRPRNRAASPLAGTSTGLRMRRDRRRHSQGRHYMVTLTVKNAAPRPRRPSNLRRATRRSSTSTRRPLAARGGAGRRGALRRWHRDGLLNSSWSSRTTETAWLAGANLAEGLDLDAYAETTIALTRAGAYQHNLVLAPGALVDGATYVFELSATFDGVHGAASVELVAVSAPTAGSCSVVPDECVPYAIHRPRDEVRRSYLVGPQ